MESPGWPQTHEDGSTTVGVRFARAPEVQPDVLQGIVTTWLADLQESGHDPVSYTHLFKRKGVGVFNCECHHRQFVVHSHTSHPL